MEFQIVEQINESPFYKPFEKMPDHFSEEEKNEILAKAEFPVQQVNRLYEMFLKFLEEN